MGGSAPKAQAQETRPLGPQHQQLQNPQQLPKAGPGITMQDEYQSAQSMQEAHFQVPREHAYEPQIQALQTAAWRLHVPQGHEVPFATESI